MCDRIATVSVTNASTVSIDELIDGGAEDALWYGTEKGEKRRNGSIHHGSHEFSSVDAMFERDIGHKKMEGVQLI